MNDSYPSASHVPPSACPHCGSTRAHEDTADLENFVPIARIGSLAEAGYLEERLAAEGIACALRGNERFDAVSGMWESELALLVPEEHVARATSVMQQELQEDPETTQAPPAADSAESFERPDPFADMEASRPRWGMWAAAVLIGAAGLGGFQLITAKPAATNAEGELWHTLTECANNQPGTIEYDPASDTLTVWKDLDGDGIGDRAYYFRGGKHIQAVGPDR